MVLTFLAVVVAMKFFPPTTDPSPIIAGLQQTLKEILTANLQPDHARDAYHSEEALRRIDSRLAGLQEKIHARESKTLRSSVRSSVVDESTYPPTPINSSPLPTIADIQPNSGWTSELSDEQKDQVALILKEHASKLRDLIPVTREGIISFDEDTVEVLRRQREDLQEELRHILDEEQYEQFVQTRAKRQLHQLSGQPSAHE